MIDPTQPFGYSISNLARDPGNKADGPFGQLVSQLARQKNANTTGDSSRTLSLTEAGTVSQNSLKLLNQTVLDALNQELEADFGNRAIENAYQQGLDVSPQATADRIVQASTAFFGEFSEKYADLAEPERLDSFLNTISTGIEKGFAEARDILGSLDVLKGNIADNIDQTFSLVQQGLDNFRARFEPSDDS